MHRTHPRTARSGTVTMAVAAAGLVLAALGGCSTADATATPATSTQSTTAAQTTSTATASSPSVQPTSTPSAGAAAALVDGPLAGTWGLTNSLGNDPLPIQFTFLADSTMTIGDQVEPPTTAPAQVNSWTLAGDQITISLNSGAAVYTGTLSGTAMGGTSTLTDDTGQPATWHASRA